MRKKSAACIALTLCVAAEENVFTGETPDRPEWQANLDAVDPAVYTDIDELDLEPGTYISVIGKTENTPYWQQVRAGVEQAAEDINERLGYSGSDEVKVLYNAPADGEDIDEQVNILDEEMSRYRERDPDRGVRFGQQLSGDPVHLHDRQCGGRKDRR